MLRLDAEARARLAGLWASGIVLARDPELPTTEAPPAQTPAGLDLDNLKEHPVAAGYRKISWAAGIDPTKQRPSGEALARRVLAGRPLPVIHPLVDAYNRASASTLVPLGAYDLDRLHLPITIRTAAPTDRFHGIGRAPAPVAPGRIVYASHDDVVCGVLLWRDSIATRIRESTQHALILAVGADPLPPSVGLDALHAAAKWAAPAGFVAQTEPVRAS